MLQQSLQVRFNAHYGVWRQQDLNSIGEPAREKGGGHRTVAEQFQQGSVHGISGHRGTACTAVHQPDAIQQPPAQIAD